MLLLVPFARYSLQESLNIPFYTMMFNAERMVLGSVIVSSYFSANVLHFFIWVMRLLEGVDGSQDVLILTIFKGIMSLSMVP